MKLRKSFTSSVIASVIALAQSENGRERTTADERIRKRYTAAVAKLTRQASVFIGVSRNSPRESLPPIHFSIDATSVLASSSAGSCLETRSLKPSLAFGMYCSAIRQFLGRPTASAILKCHAGRCPESLGGCSRWSPPRTNRHRWCPANTGRIMAGGNRDRRVP